MMRKFLIPVIVGLLCQSSFGQSLTQSTVREIYNFDIGDTIETTCGSTDGQGCIYASVEIIVITSKQFSGDTVFYGARFYDTSSYECNYHYGGSSTDSGNYAHWYNRLDSSIFWYHTYHAFGCDSNHLCYLDSVYLDSAMNSTKINRHIEGSLTGLGYDYDTAFGAGLGEIQYGYGTEDNTQTQGGCHLTYYHKANGDKWGNPEYFNVVSAIGVVIASDPSIKIFPNPTTNSVTVRFNLTQSSSLDISISDLQGNQVFDPIHLDDLSEGIQNKLLDISKLSDGLYLLECKSSLGTSFGKLVVQR